MKFATIFKNLRTKYGYTQQELANKLNVAKSTISMYERGERIPAFEIMEAIADTFNVDMDVLYGRGTPSISRAADVAIRMATDPKFAEAIQKRGVRIPVYGNVAAGIPIEAITDIEDDFEEITQEMASNGEYIALRIHGDSMSPRMTDGDIIIVRLQDDVDSGDTAVVMINGGDATCKKIKKTEDGVMLISTNPQYEPMFFSNKDIIELPIRVLGKVVELRAKF